MTPCKALKKIEAEAVQSAFGQLVIRFCLYGQIDSVVVPTPARYATRRDGLWQSTCVEAFVRSAGERYLEFNLSPSTAWAVYTFEGYRSGIECPPIDAPPIDIERSDAMLVLTAAVDIDPVEFLVGRDWNANLTAVIEEIDGTKSYWALAHPPGAPDFHYPDCFVLDLPAPSGS